MSVTLNVPIDQADITAAVADTWLTATLWYSNTPDGNYQNSSVVSSPATLALALSTEVYTFTFIASSQNPGQWFKVRYYDGVNYSPLSDSSPFHGGGGTTLVVLRQKLGLMLDDLRTGTAIATTNTTQVTHAEPMLLLEPDSMFVNWLFNNTTRGIWRAATASSQSGATITMPAITAQAAGDSFEISRRFTPSQYREAINWALASTYPTISRSITNTGYITAEDSYRYQIPQDIRTVDRVEIADADSQANHPDRLGAPWREIAFDPIQDGLLRYVELKKQLSFDPTQLKIRIRGTGPLSQLYNDSDYTEALDPQIDLTMYKAASRLWFLKLAGAASTDRDYYKEQAAFWDAAYEKGKASGAASPRQPHKMWQKQAQWARV